MRLFTYVAAAASLLISAFASEVPSSLSSDFDLGIIGLQVNFEGNRFAGIGDGTDLTQAQTAQQPVFALTDSSGINTSLQYLIMMLDTTDTNNFVLHFLQTNFKADGQQTGISSNTDPLLSYQAPGTFGETGQRQYSFLLYQQITNRISGLPDAGASFNVANFMSQNSLENAMAGLAIDVSLNGAAAATGSAGGNGNGNGNNNGNGNGNNNGNGNGNGRGNGDGDNNNNGNNGNNGNNSNGNGNGNGNQGTSTTASSTTSTSSRIIVTFESPIINTGLSSIPASAVTATTASASATGQGLGGNGGRSTSTATIEATATASGTARSTSTASQVGLSDSGAADARAGMGMLSLSLVAGVVGIFVVGMI